MNIYNKMNNKINFKEISNFNKIADISDKSYILDKDLLISNLYIDSLLDGEDLKNIDCNIKNELIERKLLNGKIDSDFNKKLLKSYFGVVVIGSVIGIGGVIINERLNRKENNDEIVIRNKLRNKRREDIYNFGDKLKNIKGINKIGVFLGKGIFKCVDLLDKLKL